MESEISGTSGSMEKDLDIIEIQEIVSSIASDARWDYRKLVHKPDYEDYADIEFAWNKAADVFMRHRYINRFIAFNQSTEWKLRIRFVDCFFAGEEWRKF